jgi:hypothetical protein
MAAGQGFKTFTTGEVLTAGDVNGYLMQGVLVFASAAARDAAITSPQEGQCCYLKDTDAVQTYSGTAWVGFDDSNAIQNSIVDAKGDIVAASGNDTPARLAVGSNGETLVADSSTATGLRYTAGNPIPNPVLNSAFQVWQRGTTASNPSSVATSYIADRWNFYRPSGFTTGITMSRQTTSDTTNLPFIQYCSRIQRAASNSSTLALYLAQNFESVNSIPYAGKTVTLSYYARAGANYSATSSILNAQLITGTGTDQNIITGYTGQSAPLSGNATLTTTWQRFSVTGSIGSSATQIATLFEFNPIGTAGANDYYEVTGVQIDIGSVALPFRTYAGTIQGELAACQRYYSRISSGSVYATYGVGMSGSATSSYVHVNFPVTMRINPTTIEYSTLAITDGYAYTLAVTNLVVSNSSVGTAALTATVASGATTTRPAFLANNNSTSGYLGFTAEL